MTIGTRKKLVPLTPKLYAHVVNCLWNLRTVVPVERIYKEDT